MNVITRYLHKMLRKKLKLTPYSHCCGADNAFESNTIRTYDSLHSNIVSSPNKNIADELLKLEFSLNSSLKKLMFKPPVAYVYYPLDYACKPHTIFTHKYCTSNKKILFVGMNPGPFGMCQTGIPFGEVNIVKDWFQINDEVIKPEKECPTRPVQGFDCPKSEVSGKRIWSLIQKLCGTPEKFFTSCFMYNYCPIAFMKENGTNVTPTEVKGLEQKEIKNVCDQTLYDVIQLLQTEIVIGVGKYPQERAIEVLKQNNPLNTKVFYLVHPSPRVKNNQDWLTKAEKALFEYKITPYLTGV